jgi:cation diffusion facilitator CzcD-associated flavoprotein CzcO
MLDWLIIGGGIHGTYLSLVLTHIGGVSRTRVRVLDPYEAPLARWWECAANTGMRSLRSPGVHHLDTDPKGLFAFAKTREGRRYATPKGVYGRPPLDLFRAHTDALIRQHKLDELRVVGRACALERTATSWCVETTVGALHTHNVLFAISASEQPHWPEWATRLRQASAPVHHIFEPGFVREMLPDVEHTVVVGGGITAAQTALALAEHAPGGVTLLQRASTRIHTFDSDACWMGPKCMRDYAHERDMSRRRAIIRQARHRGSVPEYVAQRIRKAVETGQLTHIIGAISHAALDDNDCIRLALDTSDPLCANQVILATGFNTTRPGGAWLDRATREHKLPCAPCGYPIVDQTLCWQPGLYVTGPLAELELGPVARNIAGARRAGERLLNVCSG